MTDQYENRLDCAGPDGKGPGHSDPDRHAANDVGTGPAHSLATDDSMTIREMCEAFEVTPRTLRFYEAKDLLAPVREGTRRRFTKSDRGRLTLILRAKRLGFSLENISRIFDMCGRTGADDAQHARIHALGREQLHALETQRRDIDLVIADLRGQLDHGAEAFSRGLCDVKPA